MEALTSFIKDVGFPIAVTSYLIIFMTRTMKELIVSNNLLREEVNLMRTHIESALNLIATQVKACDQCGLSTR
jgi:hypothetical protein